MQHDETFEGLKSVHDFCMGGDEHSIEELYRLVKQLIQRGDTHMATVAELESAVADLKAAQVAEAARDAVKLAALQTLQTQVDALTAGQAGLVAPAALDATLAGVQEVTAALDARV
jgi:hypothetical protein